MQKLLQVLFGLLLILVLAYVAFLDVSTKIKDDLLTKTQEMFTQNNVRGVTANVQGEDLTLSRSLVLTGIVLSEVERVRIINLSEKIEGVCRVDNQIKIYSVVPKAPIAPLIVPVPTVITTSKIKASEIKNPSKEIISSSTPKELLIIKNNEKNTSELIVEKKIEIVPTITKTEANDSVVETVEKVSVLPSVPSPKMVTAVPTVPTAVKAITAPNVIEIEKIKFEGVK